MKSFRNAVLRAINHGRCKSWDFLHGVDTCGEIPLTHLDFRSRNKAPGLEYQSHHPEIIRSSLSLLPIRFEDFAFLDFGCGKGRVLLVASEFRFKRIVGLELAPQLSKIARQNVKRFRSRVRRDTEIEVLTADATEYELPVEPQVLYFFSPFTLELMNEVLGKIERSLQQSPREMFILFSGMMARRDNIFASRPGFERLARERYVDLYRYKA